MIITEDFRKTHFQMPDVFVIYEIKPMKESIHVSSGSTFLGLHQKKSYFSVNVVLYRADAIPSAITSPKD